MRITNNALCPPRRGQAGQHQARVACSRVAVAREVAAFGPIDIEAAVPEVAEVHVLCSCDLRHKRWGGRKGQLNRGDVLHELRIQGVVGELFDVAVLPGCRNPGAVGFANDEIRRIIALPPDLA